MNLELFFLGTGGSVPTRARNLPALAIRREGRSILVDCGEGTQRQVLSVPVSLPSLEAVLLTHTHGDHVLGLPGALLSMELAGRTEELRILLPQGGIRMIEALLAPFPLSFPVRLEGLTEGVAASGVLGCRLSACSVLHRCEALGYRLDEPERAGRFDPERAMGLGVPPGPSFGALQSGASVRVGEREITPREVLGPPRPGRSVVISGDTSYCPELAEFARGADVLVHEATFAGDREDLARERGHSTVLDAARVAREAGVVRLFLVHTSPRYHQAHQIAELLREAKGEFPATRIPQDLDAFEIPFSE